MRVYWAASSENDPAPAAPGPYALRLSRERGQLDLVRAADTSFPLPLPWGVLGAVRARPGLGCRYKLRLSTCCPCAARRLGQDSDRNPRAAHELPARTGGAVPVTRDLGTAHDSRPARARGPGGGRACIATPSRTRHARRARPPRFGELACGPLGGLGCDEAPAPRSEISSSRRESGRIPPLHPP